MGPGGFHPGVWNVPADVTAVCSPSSMSQKCGEVPVDWKTSTREDLGSHSPVSLTSHPEIIKKTILGTIERKNPV